MQDTPRAGACSRQFTQSRSPAGATARMLTVIVVALALGQSGCVAWNYAAYPEARRDQPQVAANEATGSWYQRWDELNLTFHG